MLSKEQKENLQAIKDMTDTISQLLSKLINDECTQDSAAKIIGITPQEFSKNVSHNFVPFYRKQKLLSQATADEIQTMLESPYDKLIRDIFNIQDNPGYLIDYEMSEKLPDVMRKALLEREFRILTLRYGLPFDDIDAKPHTYKEIAVKERVTTERIRMICNNALKKLRSPQYSYLLFPKSDCHIASIQENDKLKELNECLDKEISKLSKNNAYLKAQILSKDKLIDLLTNSNTSSEEICNALLEQTFIPEPVYLNFSDDTKIENLDFSTRVTNALMRSHIFTLGDIKTQTWKDLRKIRSLGDKSLQELCLTLFRYGIILKSQ